MNLAASWLLADHYQPLLQDDNVTGQVLDNDGNVMPNYHHDETFWRRHPMPFTLVDEELANACSRQDNHSRMLEKVVVAEESQEYGRRMVFCAVFDRGLDQGESQAIRETWG